MQTKDYLGSRPSVGKWTFDLIIQVLKSFYIRLFFWNFKVGFEFPVVVDMQL